MSKFTRIVEIKEIQKLHPKVPTRFRVGYQTIKRERSKVGPISIIIDAEDELDAFNKFMQTKTK